MAKFALVIVCCLLVLVNVCVARPDKDAMKEKIMTVTKDCQAEVGASDSDIQDMANKKPAAGMEGKCLRACIMKKFGMMDASGKIEKSTALEFAKKCANGDNDKLQKVNSMIETCSGLDFSSNACEAAEQYKLCFYENSKDLNLAW